jgi:glycosyltransferase involved in cell wall biosynthesis
MSYSVFVIVPAFNESSALAQVLKEVVATCPNVVVVDDGSTDETHAIARAHAPFVLQHLVNRGQGAAIQTGIEFALRRGADCIVTFDADGQHDVADIDRLVDPIRRGECDVTLGSRFLDGRTEMPRARRFVLRVATLLSRTVHRLHVTDAHNGLRAFSREAARHVDITMDRMAHASEILDIVARAGLRHREVPVHVRYTKYSLSKGQSLSEAPRVLFHYVVARIFG